MRLSTGTALIAGSQGLTTLMGIAFGVIMARTLGPDGKGMFSVLSALLSAAVLCGNLGFYRSNLYYVAQNPEKRAAIAGNALWTALLFGALTAFLVQGVVEARSGALLKAIPPGFASAILIATPFWVYITYSQGILLGMGAIWACQSIDVCVKAALVGTAGVALLVYHLGLGAIIWIYVGSLILQALVYAVYVARATSWHFRLDLALFRDMVRYALRTYAATLLMFLVSRVDLFFVHLLRDDSSAGVYSIANQVVDVLSFIPLALAAQITPRIASQSGDSDVTGRAARILLLVMTAMCAIVALIAGPGIRLLYGSAFTGATPSIWILLPGSIFLGLQIVLASDLAGRGFPAVIAWLWLPVLLAAVALHCILIPRLAMPGAALVTTLAYATACSLTMIVYLRVASARLRDLVPGAEDVRSAFAIARRLLGSGMPAGDAAR